MARRVKKAGAAGVGFTAGFAARGVLAAGGRGQEKCGAVSDKLSVLKCYTKGRHLLLVQCGQKGPTVRAQHGGISKCSIQVLPIPLTNPLP